MAKSEGCPKSEIRFCNSHYAGKVVNQVTVKLHAKKVYQENGIFNEWVGFVRALPCMPDDYIPGQMD